MSELITGDQLQRFLNCTTARACVLSALLNKSLALYGINTPKRIAMSLAQMSHESAGFSRYSENLNYSAQALANTWPIRFSVDPKASVKKPNPKALDIARKPELIALAVYSNRMGNNDTTDPWMLRGSGGIQSTGKDNIGAYMAYKGFSNLYDTARLMRETDEFAIDSACWFLSVRIKALELMDKGNIKSVTRAINGGYIGLDQRTILYNKALKIFV